jgi:hypothetical protein
VTGFKGRREDDRLLTGQGRYTRRLEPPEAALRIFPAVRPGARQNKVNAVLDALRPLGIHHLDFPYSPARVWEEIRQAIANTR